MSKVFQVKPKRIKRVNGTVLTPEMTVTVTTSHHTTTMLTTLSLRHRTKEFILYNSKNKYDSSKH